MKTFIELTDFWSPDALEYVDVDQISRIEHYEETDDIYKTVTKQIKRLFFFKKTVSENILESSEIRTGSLIFMKNNKDLTYVSESPITIVDYIGSALNDAENKQRESRRRSFAVWTETIESKRNKKSKKGARK